MLYLQVMGYVEWKTHLPATYIYPVKGREATNRQRVPLTRPLSAMSTFSIVAVARRDSDLEAFSHNPTDDSFAPLVYRLST